MKKKRRCFISILSAVLMVAVMIPSTAFAAIGGTGTETDPYTIGSLEELKEFRDSVNAGNDYDGKYVVLTANIVIDGEWNPIGEGTRSGSGYTGNAFKGIFDGQGHTISGLTVKTSDDADDAVGLFGVVDGGTVQDLNLSGVDINVPGSECAGGAIGLMVNNATADRITVSGSVVAARGNGGIVGRMTISGTISNCVNEASVSGTGANVGGIVGAAYYTAIGQEMSISDCVNNGTVSGTAGAVGGIVGLSSANVSNCVNNADITGNGADVAGIVAEQQNYGSVIGCTNNGDITNNSEAYGTGGIVGWVRYNGAPESYPAKEIIEVIDNVNNGDIDGGNDGGGIIGTVYNTAVVEGNENNAENISGTTFAGGIVGNIQYTETPVAGEGDDNTVPEHDVNIYNNVSKTEKSAITAKCVGEYAYNNDGSSMEEDVYNNAKQWAASVNGDKYTVLENALEQLKDGDTLTVFNVEAGQTEIEVPEGVKVENKTGVSINVNGETIADGGIYGEQEETPTEPSDENPQQPSTEENQTTEGTQTGATATGDDTNLTLMFVIMGLAAAAAAGTVVYGRKKRHN